MKYNNDQVRRRDRLLTEARARELVYEAEYAVLSMIDEDGMPYAIPVNHVWDGSSGIYVHCAPEGTKLKAIAKHPNVCLCIVGEVNLLPSKFTTEYESIVIDCTASIGLTAEERMNALHLLLQKYSPNDIDMGMTYSEKSFSRTEIIRLHISTMSGKAKTVKK